MKYILYALLTIFLGVFVTADRKSDYATASVIAFSAGAMSYHIISGYVRKKEPNVED